MEHLPQLLRRSGHNRIYLTPKTWEHALHPNWAVVWLSSDRDQAIKQAAVFQAQFGLARIRKRYGLRVEAAVFESAHKQLRPGDPLPLPVEVKHTFRLSNAPPGLQAADIAAWGSAISWPLKPLRSQRGPGSGSLVPVLFLPLAP